VLMSRTLQRHLSRRIGAVRASGRPFAVLVRALSGVMEPPAAQAAAEASELARRSRELDARELALAAERRALDAALASMALPPGCASDAPRSDDVIALSVGGRRFVTTRATLTRVPDTFFTALFSGRFAAHTDDGGALFIDRAADGFAPLLEWLRCGAMPEGREARVALLDEADYFGITPLIQQLEVRAHRATGSAAASPALNLTPRFVARLTSAYPARQDLLDGRAHISACVAAALAGTSLQEETAARAFFAAMHRNPAQPPPLPSPPPEKLLLRPLSDKAHGETFKDAPYDGDTPLVLAHHRRPLVPGTCSIVHSKRAFKHQLQLFSRGALQNMDWAGVLLAGGACLAPLLQLPQELAAGYDEDAARSHQIYDDRTR
jgi:hypothetical protein